MRATLAFAALLLLAPRLRLWAEDHMPIHVRAELELLSVNVADWRSVCAKLTTPAEARDVADLLHGLASHHHAELLAFTVLNGFPASDGAELNSETGVEVVFPSEFRPPQMPSIFGNVSGPASYPSTPTEFERRLSGNTCILAACFSQDATSALFSMTLEFSKYLKMRTLAESRGPSGDVYQFVMPDFRTAKVHTGVRLASGERRLIWACPASESGSAVQVCLLHATWN